MNLASARFLFLGSSLASTILLTLHSQLPKTSCTRLFGILFLWQMPHFWALALRYRGDYAAGGFPMVSERVGGAARLRSPGSPNVRYSANRPAAMSR